MSAVDLKPSGLELEPTFSPAQVGKHLGLGRTAVFELMDLGRQHKGCHPRRGGLWPTFKATHKSRRIPLSAIERHKQHLAKLEGVRHLPATLLVGLPNNS